MTTQPLVYVPTVHSFSSLSMFETCEYQYEQVKIAKTVKQEPFDQASEGSRMHKAFENYIAKGVPLPQEFAVYQPVMATVDAYKGQKRAEFKMGITADCQPCGFFDKGVVIRGAADFIGVHETVALAVDWKSGKPKNPDPDQLHLMALMIFLHYRQVQEVSGILSFVAHDVIHSERYVREKVPQMWAYWVGKMAAEDKAKRSGVFNKRPSGLCRGWCPVKTCEHWEPKR